MKIKIKDTNFCPRFCYRIIRNVEIKESDQKVQNRLKASGIKVFNNIIDATNYVMLDIGQPMHVYDLDKLDKLIIKKGKHFGIKGPKIDKNTRNILLEAANFNAQDIRAANEPSTEASYRFARGVDINLPKEAIERASQMITGDKEKIIDIYPKKFSNRKIKFKTNKKAILRSLGFKIRGNRIIVPSWRYDVNIPQDLEEEVGRIYGYDKIKPEMPRLPLQVPISGSWHRLAKQSLVASGFNEVYNYSLTNQGELKINNKYLRTSLLAGIEENLKNNLKNFKEVRIFELGKVYDKSGERWVLAGAGKDFLEAKGALEKLLEDMGIDNNYFDNNWLKDNLFELDFEKLSSLASGERDYQPIPRYPAIKRDISILVDYKVRTENILQIMQMAGGNLVFDIDLFDIYEMNNKKSLAFHIIYQAMDRTLGQKEIDKIHKRIEEALTQELNAEIR